jgi:hypothetical protein
LSCDDNVDILLEELSQENEQLKRAIPEIDIDMANQNMGYNSGYRKDIKRAVSLYCETAFLLVALCYP